MQRVGCQLIFFPTSPKNFSSQWHLLWLAAFQAEIPPAWKRNPGNKQLRINLAELWRRGGSRKWDIKSLAVGEEEGESVIVLELHSLPCPIPHWRLPKNGILSCSRFSAWLRWLVVTQATSGCAITRFYPFHISLFEEKDINLKVKHLPD